MGEFQPYHVKYSGMTEAAGKLVIPTDLGGPLMVTDGTLNGTVGQDFSVEGSIEPYPGGFGLAGTSTTSSIY